MTLPLDWQLVDLGTSAIILLLVPAWLVLSRDKSVPRFLFGYGLAVLLAEALKFFFLVPRPMPFEGFGFPSSHALLAYFVATFVFLEKPRLWLPLYALASLVALSRVALGVHSLADVSVGALSGLVLAALWHMREMRKTDLTELARQSVHFLGVLLIPASLVLGQQLVGAAALVLATAVFLAAYTKGFVKRFAGFFARRGEARYYNAAYYLGSSGLVLLVFPAAAAFAGIAALAVGDSLATMYGKHFGSTKIPYNRSKTLEGSVVCLVGTYLALFFLLGRTEALVLALLATAIESLPLNDNVTLPIGVAALAYFI